MDSDLIEFNAEQDHTHLLVSYHPAISLSDLVHRLKGASSYALRKEFGALHSWLARKEVLWSPSYFASSCGGASIGTLRKYIQQQQAVPGLVR
jgi:putative transposase